MITAQLIVAFVLLPNQVVVVIWIIIKNVVTARIIAILALMLLHVSIVILDFI